MAGLVVESLCLKAEGSPEKAMETLEQAMAMRQELEAQAADGGGKALSQRLVVDLAHACFANGKQEAAQEIMHRVAAENNDDPHLIKHITSVFEKTGQEDAGKALLEKVGAEIIQLNNRGVLAARAGDLEGSVELLSKAADQVPSLQFLINAAKAIFTLLDRKGWDGELAERGARYLQRAYQKDRRNPKVASARELYAEVAKKNGIDVRI
jgi:tetratricopeptide (TPR) repeat protein